MGGYGATRIGMKHADVFGALYIMSPCCLSVRGAPPAEIEKAIAEVKTPADSAKLSFFARATLATAAAWSPNPGKPPLYLDLPTVNGEPQPEVLGRWAANSPLAFADQYIGSLRRYSGIAIDVGDQDGLRVDTAKLQATLQRYGIASTFEEYKGTHTSAVAVRFQNFVMPFFSKTPALQMKDICAASSSPAFSPASRPTRAAAQIFRRTHHDRRRTARAR